MPESIVRPFRIDEIDHVVIRCADQERALKFYVEVLGLSEERRLEQIGLVQLRAGRSLIDLVPGPERSPESGRNVDHFCLGVKAADFEGLVTYLRDRDVELIGAPSTRYGAHGMGLSVYIRDPEGNVVELKQMPPSGA